MSKIVLIGCTKHKAKVRCTADEMYSKSSNYRNARTYAERLTTKENIYILSAEYGLLRLFDVIEPYNNTLNGQPKKVIQEWSEKVFEQMEKELPLNQNPDLTILAGNNYRKGLTPLIQQQYPNINIEIPLKGMKIGEQRKFYKDMFG